MPHDVTLDALSPLDGRYAGETERLKAYFSESAFMRQRVRIEIDYLEAISRETRLIRPLTNAEISILRSLVSNFSLSDAQEIKAIEATTRHDVKAVEYFLRGRLASTSLADLLEWVHLGLTSEDVNQSATALALRDSRDEVLLPALDEIVSLLRILARRYRGTPMLARTHGQPAVPTTLGKEFAVPLARLNKTRAMLAAHRFESRLTGAVGNYNALAAAAPQIDWLAFADSFVRSYGLEPNLITTQLMPYDNWLLYFGQIQLTNSILIDLAQDVWRYISDGSLVSQVIEGEVGSSTMPHKVNPIDFENAEGNLGVSNALIAYYLEKLPVSRLQRDLSDSTVRRTFGAALGHSLVAYSNLARGFARIEANEQALRRDLESNWQVVAEGAQTILRAAGFPDAYETLKKLTRGRQLTEADFTQWVETLAVSETVKSRLRALSPVTYLGLAERIVDLVVNGE